MYARHFFHLKQIQMRHTLLFGPIFVGAAIIALFLFLLNMTQPASEEQLKSAFLLVQIGSIFLLIWCQILDLFVFFDTGAREITKGFHFRIFLWDITSFALFIFALFPVVWQLCAFISWLAYSLSSASLDANRIFYFCQYKNFNRQCSGNLFNHNGSKLVSR